MNLKSLCIYFAMLGMSNMASSQDKLQIPYRQKVHRDDRYFSHWLRGGKGYVTLTDDSLIFKTDKKKNGVFNFALAYCEIKSIRTWYFFLCPNRIRIKVINDGSYRVFTYKRKNIIAITRGKMMACRQRSI